MEKTTEQNQMELKERRIAEEEDVIDLKEVFYVLLGGWKAIFLAMLIGAAAFGAYHHFMITPSYQADAMIYITNTDSVITFSDLQLSSALTEDYTNIIKSRTVLNRVIDELDLDINYKQLGNLVSVENPESTHIIHIYVTTDDLELSRNIANALLNVSVSQIYQIIGSSEPTIIDYAEAEAVENVTPGLTRYMAMGALLGAVVVCAVLIIRMLMNTTMKTEEDIDKYLHLPVLAAVPYYNEHTTRKGK
ncbi:chain length determinant protein [Marvinbryantia formatexigens DSM 14469]|uniref:Chain length determinant protein n=2 Tax=Marvinbryantia TaxID=248744 RepID=C6LKT4_9FIRM|nr:Wzz/FepE/Etk N-terminal domain-containing protein [Marvinbryantia formatexigens]EET58821.1 chain length determinant protein [Marvinbryantia formatexigens DSM 14469]UWO24156.1 Wzz/FepE/Etk N-terminal domain-containing protein [Marvinbryantia formatexigens DSM 14469]SDG70679.1 Capsular polysaccharide biosynthesis protein [Marvinbryantia formatexigens]